MQFHRQCYYKTWIKSNHNIEHADKLDTTVYGDVKKTLTYWTKVLQLKLIYIVNTVHQILRCPMLILYAFLYIVYHGLLFCRQYTNCIYGYI